MENVEDIYPLSPMQQLMLMHSLRRGGASTLVNQFRYELHGALDVERLRAAWQRAVDRHPALRSAFVWEEVDHPVQVVRTKLSAPLEFIDLGGLDERAQVDRIDELQRADRERGFDLRRAPLIRLTAIRIAPGRHLLLWTRHHLILDLWSVELLFDEVFGHYENPHREVAAPGLFRDYLAWLQRQDSRVAEHWWREYLAGLREPTLLTTSRPRRSEWLVEGQPAARREIPSAQLERLERFARTAGVSFNTLVQGAIATLLARRSGRDDVLYGLTVSGRPPELPAVERAMGSFINNVPQRVHIDREARIDSWLGAIQRAQAARAPHEWVSPTDIQRWSALPSHVPMFDLLVLLQSPVAAAPAGSTLRIEALPGPYDSALPVTLALERGAEGAVLTAVYDAAILSADEADALLADVCAALEQLAVDHEAPLGTVLAAVRSEPEAGTGATTAGLRAAPDAGRGDAVAAPADVLLSIWRDTLGVPDAGLDDDFFALGGTSVQAAIAFAEIERRLGRALPLATLFTAGSVRKLLPALDLPPAPAASLVTIQRLGRRPPILAASGIGGNVVGLAEIARALGAEQPFYGLQSRGLDGVQAPASSIEAIAADFVAEIEPLGDRPLVLLGICFGASVMLEMAHRLAAQGRPPALLVVLDPAFDDGDGSAVGPAPRAPNLVGFLWERLQLYVAAWRDLDAAGRRRWLREKGTILADKLRHRDLLHGNRVELTQRRVQAANLTAARAYRPRPYAGRTRVILTADRNVTDAHDPRRRWIEELVPNAPSANVPGQDTGDAVARHAGAIAVRLEHWIDESGLTSGAAPPERARGAAGDSV